jgi:hypothetical protein
MHIQRRMKRCESLFRGSLNLIDDVLCSLWRFIRCTAAKGRQQVIFDADLNRFC